MVVEHGISTENHGSLSPESPCCPHPDKESPVTEWVALHIQEAKTASSEQPKTYATFTETMHYIKGQPISFSIFSVCAVQNVT